ncbi:MAG: sensor histidine kinase [Pseudoclavibacter sp.]
MNEGPREGRRQTVVAGLISLGAAASTGWLSDAPVLTLAIVAIAAIVLVLLTPHVLVRAVLCASTATAVAVRLPEARFDEVVLGLVFGLLTALVLAAPLLIRRAMHQRQEFQRRGWELAAVESRRRAGETQAALQRERMTLAAEMHDGLGHSLTLIAVRLGQLSLAKSLSDDDRAQVASIRETAAEASDELGLAVRLLRHSEDPFIGSAPPTVEDAIAGARDAGMSVDAHIDSSLADRLSDEASNAVARMIQETLTNAAKHAPGERVTVHVAAGEERVVARVSSLLPARGPQRNPRSSEFGLHGLRHRAEMLDGELEVDRGPDRFSVVLTLPVHARPSVDRASHPGDVVAAENAAASVRSRASRAALALPIAIASAVAFVPVGYFVLAGVLSVISESQFSEVAAGDDREIVERMLPALEMLDPPRDDFPPRADEECFYYEAEISFFERVDVFVVCFASGQVSRTGTVAAS